MCVRILSASGVLARCVQIFVPILCIYGVYAAPDDDIAVTKLNLASRFNVIIICM